MSSSDGRQHPRYAIELAVELRTEAGFIGGRTDNLSKGGVCAVVAQAVPAGTVLQISMALVFDEGSRSEPLLLPARVVWCTGLGEGRYQIGTAFLPLARGQHDYLVLFLRYLEEGMAVRRAARSPDPEPTDDSDDDESIDPFA